MKSDITNMLSAQCLTNGNTDSSFIGWIFNENKNTPSHVMIWLNLIKLQMKNFLLQINDLKIKFYITTIII
jgi:hypothetical protein